MIIRRAGSKTLLNLFLNVDYNSLMFVVFRDDVLNIIVDNKK